MSVTAIGGALLGHFSGATPSPTPTVPPADLVTPGVWGFVAIFAIGIVTLLLILDMNRRIRRTRYREQIARELDAEERERRDDDAP